MATVDTKEHMHGTVDPLELMTSNFKKGMIMIKKHFKSFCAVLGIAGLIGCANNGTQPVSLDSDGNSLTATVGTNGASYVAQCANYRLAVGNDTWANGNHKIFILSGTTWLALSAYSSIDAWKVTYDQYSGSTWIIDTDNNLWKDLEQQYFTSSNNGAGRTGAIKAYDLTMGQIGDGGTGYGIIYILNDEPGTYGYVIWRLWPLTQYWDRYFNAIEGSGLAIAANPNEESEPYSGDMWVVRDDGTLWLWNCSNMSWQQKASDCRTMSVSGDEIRADVSVAANENVYYLKNTYTGYNYYIAVSTNRGTSWFQSGYGQCVGATQTGWCVHYSGSIYKHISGSTWTLY